MHRKYFTGFQQGLSHKYRQRYTCSGDYSTKNKEVKKMVLAKIGHGHTEASQLLGMSLLTFLTNNINWMVKEKPFLDAWFICSPFETDQNCLEPQVINFASFGKKKQMKEITVRPNKHFFFFFSKYFSKQAISFVK